MDTRTYKGTQENSRALVDRFHQLLALERGTIINDRFHLEELLGKGGFGIVFKAYDKMADSEIALKFLNPATTAEGKKFKRVLRELKLSRELKEPRLITIYSLENWQGIYFLVMEYYRGHNLKEILAKKGSFPWKEFKPLFFDILTGVQALHRAGIIHRDLKPSNIFITSAGEVKILDFGLAKEISDPEKTASFDELVGSPKYMSPDQIKGLKLDQRSDLYQLGLILFEALTGKHPYHSSTPLEYLNKHLNEPPPRIESLEASLPAPIAEIIVRSLQKERNKRQGSIAAMLEQTGNETGTNRHPSSIKGKWLLVPIVAIVAFAVLFIYNNLHGPFEPILQPGSLTPVVNNPSKPAASPGRSGAIVSVEQSGGVLIARDEADREIWRYKPPGYDVFRAYLIEPGDDISPRRNVTSKKFIIAYLAPLDSDFFLPGDTIDTTRFDNRIVFLDTQGRIIYENSFTQHFHIDTQDFLPATYFDANLCSEQDLDGDGKLERVLGIRHQGGMFPAAFSIENEGRFIILPNPGALDKTAFSNTGPGVFEIFLFGNNNLMAHSSFAANLSSIHGYLRYSSFPSMVHNAALNLKGSRPTILYILPRSNIKTPNEWFQKGVIEIQETVSGHRVSLFKDGVIKVNTGEKEKVYYDDPQLLQTVYDDIDDYFLERWINGRMDKAYQAVYRAVIKPATNPYLLSVLYYFKGDLEILRGDFKRGKASLEQALLKNPANSDAAQRLCEWEFLAGNISGSIELMQTRFAKIPVFWGMGVGKLLYIFYCQLHQGQFQEANPKIPELQRRYPQAAHILQATCHIFKGNYSAAVELLQQKFNIRNKCTTVQDLRCLAFRALILAGQDLERAESYLEELALFSRTRNHLVKVSLAYLQVKKGSPKAASTAKKAFKRIVSYARGDFETRLWLFYDAFIYAKTMELLADSEEALRGYRMTIEANPHTGLARDANDHRER